MFGSDLSFEFRVFGIPVRVSLFFFILALLLGRSWAHSPARMAAWVLIVFLSVLLHEMGHALMARLFGQQPFITLHGVGGLTTWRSTQPLSAGRRFAVAFAGPVAGLGLAVFAAFVGALFFARGSGGREIMAQAAAVNLFWAVLNLIPMLPLDGGNIASSLFDLLSPGRGRRLGNYLSIPTAIVVGALAIMSGMFVFALICGFAIWINVQELRRPPAPPTPPAEAVIDIPAQPMSKEVNPDRDNRPL